MTPESANTHARRPRVTVSPTVSSLANPALERRRCLPPLSELDQARSSVQLPYRWMRPLTDRGDRHHRSSTGQAQHADKADGDADQSDDAERVAVRTRRRLGLKCVPGARLVMWPTVDSSRTSSNQTKHVRSSRHS
jgi:hypothetical protein